MNIPLDPETAMVDLLTDILPHSLDRPARPGDLSVARWRTTDDRLFALARLLVSDSATRQTLAAAATRHYATASRSRSA